MTPKNGNGVLAKSMRADIKTIFSNLFTNQDLEWGDYPAKVERGNSNGLLLLLCATHDLVITNTIFRILNHDNTSWMYPHSRHWHLIDYVIQERGTGMTWEWQGQCALQTVGLTIGLVLGKYKLRIPPTRRPQGQKAATMLNSSTTKSSHDAEVQSSGLEGRLLVLPRMARRTQHWRAVGSLQRCTLLYCIWKTLTSNPQKSGLVPDRWD